MAPTPRILVFAGSTRRDSLNKRLARAAAESARAAGDGAVEVTLIDLADYPMPLYDGDLEAAEGMPAKAKEFKELMKAHQGLLIASPEYNSSISAVLKNAIDWASRPEAGEKPLVAFGGKVAGIMAASPGALGGLRGLVALRSILGNIQVLVVPEQLAVTNAATAFDESGRLKDEKQRASLDTLVRRVCTVAGRLHA